MTSFSSSEEALRQQIVDLFREKCSSGASDAVLPLKDIVRETKAEKKTVNRVLHNSPHHFTKMQVSPPFWKCTVDLSQSTTTNPIQASSPAATNIVTSTPEVKTEDSSDVVVSKVAAAVESPSKKEKLKSPVLAALGNSPKPMKALDIAKKIGYQTAGDVNPTLYALREEGKVSKKGQDGWSTEGAVTIPDISSLKLQLDGKPLYTQQEITDPDGRKGILYQEVLTRDYTKPSMTDNATGKDTTDGKYGSTEQHQLDSEMLGLLSSLFDNADQYSQALKIVKLLRESVDKTVEDAEILCELEHDFPNCTRLDYHPILSTLELNNLVKKMEVKGCVNKWKWIAHM